MISFIIFFGGAMLCFFAMCVLGPAGILAYFMLARELGRIDPERWAPLEFSAYFEKRGAMRMAAIKELVRSREYKSYSNRRVSFLGTFILISTPVYIGAFFAIPLLLLGLAVAQRGGWE
jgi:hypothetical protein